MHFIQIDYLFVFLPVVVGLYYVFRTSPFANVIIMLASYYFYGSAGIFYLLPLMFTSIVDYVVGIKIEESDDQRKRFALLMASVVANLGLLFFFKYATWVLVSTNHLLAAVGATVVLPIVTIPLPPGISFYTFQTMSYTIEVYRREMKASRNIVNYMSFVTFWPHLVAGPIMRAHVLLTQLERVRPVISADEARYAILLITWGLAKKLVLADNFGNIVDSIDSQSRSGTAWAGAGLLFAYAFAGQIYCDFSAYTTIARGSAKLIGVELPRNFLTPYFSQSPSEFWRRWHISLSTWLRDYLYFTLGGNRKGRAREYLNLFITMVLGGIWHGAGILFLLWGAWHGLILILYRVFPLDKLLSERLGFIGRGLSIFIMFQLVCFGWLMFRADTTTFGPFLSSIGAMFTTELSPTFFLFLRGLVVLALVTAITDWFGYRRDGEFEDAFARFGMIRSSLVIVVCYFAITLLGKREGAQFIYFQF